MKKLVIGLLVVVMALGTMGVAFANSLGNGGPPDAIMAQGFMPLDDLTCTGIQLEAHIGCSWDGTFQRDVEGFVNYLDRNPYAVLGSDPTWDMGRNGLRGENAELGVYGVYVQFDKNLREGTAIFVALDDSDGHIVDGNRWAEGHIILGADVALGTWIYVPLEGAVWGNDEFIAADCVKVRVVGATVPVE